MVKDPQTAGFGLVVSLFCRNQSQTKQCHRESGIAPAKAEISPSKKCNALVVSIVFLFFWPFIASKSLSGRPFHQKRNWWLGWFSFWIGVITVTHGTLRNATGQSCFTCTGRGWLKSRSPHVMVPILPMWESLHKKSRQMKQCFSDLVTDTWGGAVITLA